MARPTATKETSARMLALRLTDDDRELLEALVREKAKALASEGVEVTASSVVRSLIRQAAAEAGLARKASRK